MGFATTVSAIGMLVGSLFLSSVGIKKEPSRILQLALLSLGFFMAAFAWKENEILVCIFGFCIFLSLPFANMSIDYLVRITIPAVHQGKAWGLLGLISQVCYVAAYASTGIFVNFIINPFLQSERKVSDMVLALIGRGEGRGAALMVMIAGICLMIIALVLPRKSEIRELEEEVADTV